MQRSTDVDLIWVPLRISRIASIILAARRIIILWPAICLCVLAVLFGPSGYQPWLTDLAFWWVVVVLIFWLIVHKTGNLIHRYQKS